MNHLPHPNTRCGFAATRLMIVVIAVVALTAVIKSFSYAAQCYAGVTQTLNSLGNDK